MLQITTIKRQQRGSHARARANFKAIEAQYSNGSDKFFIPTHNRLLDRYGAQFDKTFWNTVGVNLVEAVSSNLIPVTVDPMTLYTAQLRVISTKIARLLKAPVRSVFNRIVRDNPKQPLIVVKSPIGYIIINGNHRVFTMQLRGDRKAQAFMLPETHELSRKVRRIFRRRKAKMIRLMIPAGSRIKTLRFPLKPMRDFWFDVEGRELAA